MPMVAWMDPKYLANGTEVKPELCENLIEEDKS
jgi:hypothetical protein